MLERSYACPEDLAQARIADSQGLGAAVPREPIRAPGNHNTVPNKALVSDIN